MGMVENQKKFYLYDRWFAYQNQVGDKLVYISVPKVSSSYMKLEIDRKTNEITLFYLNGKKVVEKIEISDITQPNIELHYIQEACDAMEIGDNEYDNLSIELFTSINKGSIPREYQMMFVKKNKKSKFIWVEPPLPLNEKMNISDIDFESRKVAKFIDFASAFPMSAQKIRKIILTPNEEEKKEELHTIKEIIIPQELEVYDRVYHLINITENKIILSNNEDGIRNLEIKYDPFASALLSVSLRIKESNVGKGIIRIAPNKSNGITARYCNKKKSKIRVGSQNIETAKIHSNMIFDSNNKRVETNILIFSKGKQIELLEHPYIKYNYTDGAGNLYTVNGSGYNVFYGIAAYSPGIFHYIENEMFKPKVLKKVDNTEENL